MKNPNTLLLFILMLMLASPIGAQPWMKKPYLETSKSEAGYYDICKAFDKYWNNRPYQKGKGYMQFKRWEYMMRARCYPHGKIPSPLSFYNEYRKFLSGTGVYTSRAPESWKPLGLTSWINGESGYNPGNGRLNAVTVDMKDRNRIYVAAASGGIWISNDGGMSWNTTFDTLPVLGTSTVAIHPQNPSVIYAGTGDRDGWNTMGTGIYKSTDGGLSWTPTGMHFAPDYRNINKILINPLNPNTLFAATTQGISRSRNGGLSWQTVYAQSEVKNLRFKPNDTSVIYGCGEFFVRSANGGSSFTKNTTSLPNDTVRIEIDVTLANPQYVYALVSRPDNTFEGVYRSVDGGVTFSPRCNAPNILGYADDGSDDSGQAWYDLALAVSPNNANEVFVGGINVWKSTDGGANFTVNTMWYTNSPYTYIHCDIHSLDFYGDTLYCGSDGGIFYTPDHGASWGDLSVGLGISQFYGMGSSENSPYTIAAGAQDVGSNLLRDGQWTHVYGADGMEAIVDHSNPDILFVSYQSGGLLKSVDGGLTFEGVKPYDTLHGSWVTPYVMHPSDHNLLFAGFQEVYRTQDGALTWTQISQNLNNGDNLEKLVVAPSNPAYIYASWREKLYYTSDGGANWNSSVPFPGLYITGIATDPGNPQRIWVCLSAYGTDRVMTSVNGGVTFTNITGNLSDMGFNCIVYQKNAAGALYLGTQTGVFYTDSLIGQWIPYNTDLPNVIVNELEINYGMGLIRAATYGRGIWEAPLRNQAGIAENSGNPLLSIWPNPASDLLYVSVAGELTENFTLTLFNVAGIPVRQINGKYQEPVNVRIAGLAPGSYYLRYDSKRVQTVQKVLIGR